MGNITYVSEAWLQETDCVFRPKAVAHKTDPLTLQAFSHVSQNRMNHRINSVRQVSGRAFEPCHEVEIRRPIERYWVAVEEVRHDYKEAIASKLIRYQLGVDKFMSNDI